MLRPAHPVTSQPRQLEAGGSQAHRIPSRDRPRSGSQNEMCRGRPRHGPAHGWGKRSPHLPRPAQAGLLWEPRATCSGDLETSPDSLASASPPQILYSFNTSLPVSCSVGAAPDSGTEPRLNVQRASHIRSLAPAQPRTATCPRSWLPQTSARFSAESTQFGPQYTLSSW